ncbi:MULTISPECIES: SDR family oxidoreductase [unclassified Agarivorans]|uniref:SDR family oxidoreductase n=1 Tax=unclassified Agarivorans TaxID=2636026 RepID=UPI003D7DC63E
MSQSKIALVTGGSKGIGASIVNKLAAEGYAVGVNYSSSADVAESLVADIKASGGNAIAVQGNVGNSTEVAHMFNVVEEKLGAISLLVNNAGIMKLAQLSQSDEELFDSQVAVNFKGTFNTLRLAAERVTNGGRIINLSTSIVGLKLESYGVYAATKSAVETMSAILAKELRGRCITVNTVAPGPTATNLFLDGKSPQLIDRLANMNPLERLGTPQDIANVVMFLASPEGGWINGQVIRANGGMI